MKAKPKRRPCHHCGERPPKLTALNLCPGCTEQYNRFRAAMVKLNAGPAERYGRAATPVRTHGEIR